MSPSAPADSGAAAASESSGETFLDRAVLFAAGLAAVLTTSVLAAVALAPEPLVSVSSLASRTPASLSSRRMDRASAGVSPACSNAVRRSERDRWPWLRPRWIRSSTRVELASSSCAGAAMAIRGMRHLPPSIYVRISCAVQQHVVLRPQVAYRQPARFHR